MPILVNGELLPRVLVQEEAQRLAAMPAWQNFPEGPEKQTQLRRAAEICAIERLLLLQEAAKDSRPLDPELLARERRWTELDLRFERTMRELMGPVPKASDDDIQAFYAAHGHNFRRPETVHAAHIVRHVDATHPEEEARAGIEAALAELESGEPFAAVVEHYSNCKDNAGDLGSFARGTMAEEFENVVFALQQGQRSPIFRSPFGFHIAEVRSREPDGVMELSEVKPTIEQFLTAVNEQAALQRVAEVLRARADIRRISIDEADGIVARQAGSTVAACPSAG